MLSEIAFYLTAALTVIFAVAAMTLPRLVHCAVCAAAAFASLALIYLQLDAEFVAFAQLLVYVGAIAILIVFAVLLTSVQEADPEVRRASRSWVLGFTVALFLLAALGLPIISTPALQHAAPAATSAPVKDIGDKLMTTYVLPLEMIGVLLTSALLGAVVIAMREDSAVSVNQVGERKPQSDPEEALLSR
jgi:NADH-quinone oxidoreductase subunit J